MNRKYTLDILFYEKLTGTLQWLTFCKSLPLDEYGMDMVLDL